MSKSLDGTVGSAESAVLSCIAPTGSPSPNGKDLAQYKTILERI
jgi:hypothetical protein